MAAAIPLIACLLALLGRGAGPVLRGAQDGDQDLVAAGRRVYEVRKCHTCHMIAGQGNVRFNLDGVGARLPASDLRRWLTDPSAMERALPKQPAVRMSDWLKTNRKISDADVDALVAYLSSLK